MLIKDELYGTMEFSGFEQRIIDTADFQRLRSIRQMSFTNLVYPGANHSRFEHSLGTAHLSALIARKTGLEGEMVEKIKLYALLHDIGHTAFSHEGEHVLLRYLGSHEKLGRERIAKGEIADILGENYRPAEITALEGMKEGSIVCSDLGADRMDYLRRDAQNTGVAYGVIDTDRLVHTLSLYDGSLVIDERGLTAAESMLIARFMMFSAVYLHPTVRIATAMLCRAIELSIKDGTVAPEQFAQFSDEVAMFAMSASPSAKGYVNGLHERKLYKSALSVELGSRSENDAKRMEAELQVKFKTDIIIDYPYTFHKKSDFLVKTGNGVVPITKLSALVGILEKSGEERRQLLVLCPAGERERIRHGLQKSGNHMR